MKRSFLCILICLMLVVGALASCADSGDEQSSSGSLSQSVSGNGGEGFKYDGYFNGQTVKILCVNTDRHLYGELQFVPNDELTGNANTSMISYVNRLIGWSHRFPTTTTGLLTSF